MNDSLQSKQHKQRIVTALVAVILAGAAYFYLGILSIQIFVTLIALAASYEALLLLLAPNQAPGRRSWKIGSSLFLTLLFYSLLMGPTNLWAQLTLVFYPYIGIVAFFGQALVFSHRDNDLSLHLRDALVQFFVLLYIPGLLIYVPGIHELRNGHIWFLLLLVSVWAGDVAAYYGGKTFGKHKLSVNLSPGKTWEGSLCSLLFVTVSAAVIGAKFLPAIPTWKPALIVGLASIAGQLGDLIKSLIKRVAGVKDSGNLFPGHGGAFDRFDSLILAAPLFYLLVAILT